MMSLKVPLSSPIHQPGEIVMAGAPGDKSMEIHLEPKEWMLLCHLHGGRSVRELVDLTGYNDFETAKILYGMYSAGLIEKLGEDASAV